MVGKTGFEPATPWSQTRCTTKLCYFPLSLSSLNGALGRNRTHNLLIRSQALYPVELLALFLSYNAFLYYHIPLAFASRFLRNGAQGRNRTGTDFEVRRILSPVRLPVSPPGHIMEVPTGLEPMITELQSVALPTWPWNLFHFNPYLLPDCFYIIYQIA